MNNSYPWTMCGIYNLIWLIINSWEQYILSTFFTSRLQFLIVEAECEECRSLTHSLFQHAKKCHGPIHWCSYSFYEEVHGYPNECVRKRWKLSLGKQHYKREHVISYIYMISSTYTYSMRKAGKWFPWENLHIQCGYSKCIQRKGRFKARTQTNDKE